MARSGKYKRQGDDRWQVMMPVIGDNDDDDDGLAMMMMIMTDGDGSDNR